MFTYRPRTIPQNIYVVGCGGTGSRLVPLLTQFMRTISKAHTPQGWVPDVNIVLIDGDIVEEKNLLRQNFIASDVNKNKAAVLAQRYGKAYGMNVLAYPEFISDADVRDKTIRKKIPGLSESNVAEMLIMCVDSAEARRKVLNAFAATNGRQPMFIIDAGNEDDFGQVRFFNQSVLYEYDKNYIDAAKKHKNPQRIEIEQQIDFLPYDHVFYKNLVDNPGLGSCADLNQTLAINALMATLIMGVVQNYYYVKPFNYNGMSISLSGSVSCEYNTVANFRNKMLHDPEDTNHLGVGGRYGFLQGCNSIRANEFLETFIVKNQRAVAVKEREAEAARKKAEREAAAKLAEEKAKEVVIPEGENAVLLEEVKPEPKKRSAKSKFQALVEATNDTVDVLAMTPEDRMDRAITSLREINGL